MKKLAQQGIPVFPHKAVQMKKSDAEKYDFIIGMDSFNLKNIQRILGSSFNKNIFLLLDFTLRPGNIADPWYTGNFDAGVDVGMVQVGNEINNGMSDETDVPSVMKLLTAGSKAVRESAADYNKDILVALHYTNITDNDQVDTMAANLKKYNVDYDVFGLLIQQTHQK